MRDTKCGGNLEDEAFPRAHSIFVTDTFVRKHDNSPSRVVESNLGHSLGLVAHDYSREALDDFERKRFAVDMVAG